MNNFTSTLCGLGLGLLVAQPIQADMRSVDNEPDSVYLFSYANADGTGGLKLAYSTDGKRWNSIGNERSFVNSDFGPWGSHKKMFAPHLVQNRKDGRWSCTWSLGGRGKAMAAVSSPDLCEWRSQQYFDAGQLGNYEQKDVFPTRQIAATVNGQERKGWQQRVAYQTVQKLIQFSDHKTLRWMQNQERTEQDAVRFANLQPVEASVKINASDAKKISEELIGIFFEDINYAADGGLYAELIQNRDFEYSALDGSRAKDWDHQYAWKRLAPTTPGKTKKIAVALTVATDEPIHENNPHYLALHVETPDAGVANIGYDGIVVKKGEKYDLSFMARIPRAATEPASKGGKVRLCLVDKSGEILAEKSLNVKAKDWKTYQTTLVPSADATEARLEIRPQATGTYHLDMVSLFPRNTFKGHKNGLRQDLAQTLADLHPRFVRFPGGCVAHGDGIDNIYDWKGSIGPLEARKPLRNLWGYHQTRGLGYHEYFQFCEDMGAEPVPVLAAGVPCQNSGSHSHHADGCGQDCNYDLMRYGQQGGIDLKDMPAYIQDVLDLIEYANGDARKTVWGRKRAENGHPKPFNMKYIGIGNEDMITEVFEERFKMIYEVVREKHPEITVIGTVGPFYEGTDYNEGWRLASELQVPMVDEHYYVDPGWMIHNQNYYDRYDRSKSKVYLGEYAAHLPGRPNNIETALAEALYLTAVERNADVVTMTSYAPLLAKEGHTQWNPDLIYFNNAEVKPTVGYYTQQMYGQNSGTHYLASQIQLSNTREDVQKRIGVSVVKDERTGDLIVKLVNMLPVQVKTKVDLGGYELVNPSARKTLLTGDPKDKKAKSVTSAFELDVKDGAAVSDFAYEMPAYSFTVIRIHSNKVKE